MIKRPRPANIVIIILGLMYFITYLDRVNVSTAAAGFATEFVLNKTQIGLVFSAFAYPYLIFQIIGGWISDRFGARRTLIACGLLWARLCTGHYPCRGAGRQRCRARRDRRHHGGLRMAQLIFHLRVHQFPMGRAVGPDVHRVPERPPAGLGRGAATWSVLACCSACCR
jgi:MFS family permease